MHHQRIQHLRVDQSAITKCQSQVFWLKKKKKKNNNKKRVLARSSSSCFLPPTTFDDVVHGCQGDFNPILIHDLTATHPHDDAWFKPIFSTISDHSKRPYMYLRLAGWLVPLSLSHKTFMIWTVSDTDRQTESIANLSSHRCDRLGEAQLCSWSRRVGVKASVDPRAHVHPPAPQVPYSPLFPVQGDTARTAPSSNLSPQRTRIFLLLLLLLLLLFLLTPTREMQSKCNDKTAQQHHTRESTTFDPQHQT